MVHRMKLNMLRKVLKKGIPKSASSYYKNEGEEFFNSKPKFVFWA
jgi:hypothetical protein